MSIAVRWTVTLAGAILLLVAGTMAALELVLRAEETRAAARWQQAHAAQLEERLELLGLRAQRDVTELASGGELEDVLAPVVTAPGRPDRRVVRWAAENATRFGLDQILILAADGRVLTDALCPEGYGEPHPQQAYLRSCLPRAVVLWTDRRCGPGGLATELPVVGAVQPLRLGGAQLWVVGGRILDERALAEIGEALDWSNLRWGDSRAGDQVLLPPAGWQLRTPVTLAGRLGPSPALAALGSVRRWALLVAIVLVLTAALAAPWLARGLARPLVRLAAAVQAVGEGTRKIDLRPEGPAEVRELGRALVEMTTALEEAEARIRSAERRGAWREIAQRVAHEIKNTLSPLSLALDNVETMAARSDPAASDPRLATTLRTAHEQLRSLDRLVTEFRTFARSPHIALAPLDAVAVCEAAAAAARQAHPDASVQVVAMDAPGPVLGDAEQLRRAVVNLLLNAAEAAPGRPIELRTGTGPGADHWWIAVRDQGGGLPEHVAARIGEPYLTTKEGGTGLGLAVVIQIAEAHAGRLRHRHLGSGGFEMRLELSTAPGEGAS